VKNDQPVIALLSEPLDLSYLLPAFRAEAPDAAFRVGRSAADLGDLGEIDAVATWQPPAGVLAQLPNLKLVQSIAAGIDHITADRDLPQQVPLCRIVDDALAAGMCAYVAWAVVDAQRHMGRYRAHAAQAVWKEEPIVSPHDHTVGIVGMGTLGTAVARTLTTMGYPVAGWSRSAKAGLPAGVQPFVGADALGDFLARCQTLVCLLPLTAETTGFLNASLFARLPRGAHLINVGRGAHLVEADLLAALDSGQLGAATLDTFSTEPLPPGHPFWQAPAIRITPHIATRTNYAVVARQTLANLATLARGERPAFQVDLARGY